MSPDRGHEPSSVTRQRSVHEKSIDRADSGYGDSIASEGELRSPTERPGSFCYDSTESCSQKDSIDQQQTMDAARQEQTATSLKSTSSTVSSRRDSAISSSSRHRQRPKASRSFSKQSLKSAQRDQLSQASSLPSRQRPRRLMSSPCIPSPRANIDEALALHKQSCRIFGDSSRPSTSYATPATTTYPHPGMYRSLSSTDALPLSHYYRPFTPFPTTADATGLGQRDAAPEYDNFVPATVIHWTSEETRRQEYAKIDKYNTGVRGFFKKLFPKIASKSSESRFYDEKDGSDAGSVRRIRLDSPEKGS